MAAELEADEHTFAEDLDSKHAGGCVAKQVLLDTLECRKGAGDAVLGRIALVPDHAPFLRLPHSALARCRINAATRAVVPREAVEMPYMPSNLRDSREIYGQVESHVRLDGRQQPRRQPVSCPLGHIDGLALQFRGAERRQKGHVSRIAPHGHDRHGFSGGHSARIGQMPRAI